MKKLFDWLEGHEKAKRTLREILHVAEQIGATNKPIDYLIEVCWRYDLPFPPEGYGKPSRSVSLKTRYRILERDRFRCVLCGANASETTLEVDHIVPVSQGGSNHPGNLQTLCFDCNRGKSDWF